VRDLVELHGGAMRAESDGEGQGSTFTMDIPAALDPAHDRGLTARPDPGPRALATVRVLLIEDETDALELARTALTRCGAHVSAVSSSAEAVSAILTASAESLPHVVVSDIGMPFEDGYVFIQQLRALAPERGGSIPAVTVTDYGAPDDVHRALAAGYQMHLSKPVDPLALIDAVAQLSKNRR
jgi:CheY-like chemotaxis protein